MIAAPFCEHRETVRPEWMSASGLHMNLAYYVVMFHGGSTAILNALGIDTASLALQRRSCFAAETHLVYEREMNLGEEASIRTTIMNADAKRLHLAHEMFRGDESGRICLQEIMFLSVDLQTRRSAPWSPTAWQRISAALTLHNALPRPAKTGRAVGIRG